MFSYPVDHQLDVPIGSRVVVTFSDPVVASAADAFAVVGPDGPVGTPTITEGGRGVEIVGGLAPATTYQVTIGRELAPFATNLPAGPLLTFTTRADQPRSQAATLVAINGGSPSDPESFRPMFESSTIRLVFSEPLDPRTVLLAPNAIELVDDRGQPVPATLVGSGIHVSLDPIDDLAAGTTYQVRIGNSVLDLGRSSVAPATVALTPQASFGGKPPIGQKLRTRQPKDPGPELSRAGAPVNEIAMDKPLIGRETSTVQPAVLAAELGDPKALGGPLAFTIRRGQRVSLSPLNIKLGGAIPANLETGDIFIEFVTDAGGRLYRNPYHPVGQRPENRNAPLFVDLAMDVAVYTKDRKGNAVIAQTIYGVQATGTAVATDGVLALEVVAAMDLSLLGVTQAPTNMVLELITDPSATVPVDTTPPTLLATLPNDLSDDHAPGDAIELVFDEPIDLDRARAGGVRLLQNGSPVAAVIESHGASVVVRPLQRLPYSTSFTIELGDVADMAGNPLAITTPISFQTARLGGTGAPLMVAAIHPGVPCAVVNGHCAGGLDSDDSYRPFELAANEPIDVVFTQPVNPATVTLGTACGGGSVRVEQLDGAGNCVAAVPGTLIRRDRAIHFVPDLAWTIGGQYRLALISGGNNNCDGGELCGISGDAASFDPLSGTTNGDSGGPPLVVDFTVTAPTAATYLIAEASPFSDMNGSGFLDSGEPARDDNRAALRITGTTGAVSSASFAMADCLPETPEVEGCLYLAGAMPVELGEVTDNCTLPTGEVASACVPVGLAAQAMFGTSLSLDARVGITINTDTGTAVLRIREPATGPVQGFIIDGGGGPKMVLGLELYMDAPDMSIPLSDHDLISKPMSIVLEGPVTFQPDGRIAIQLTNRTDVPLTVNIDAPLGLSGAVQMSVPVGAMKLQLLSRPLRGVEP